MQRTTSSFLPLALLALALAARPVHAETLEYVSSDGPIRLHLDPGGEVHGFYPKRQGEMFGHVGADGTIRGIWTQPRSDHPCHEMRRDTYAWGGFLIANPYRHSVAGYWGYCGEEPQRDWQLERR